MQLGISSFRLFTHPEVVGTPDIVFAMDVTKAIETYITKMVSEPSAIKVLLLDSHTVRRVLLAIFFFYLTLS